MSWSLRNKAIDLSLFCKKLTFPCCNIWSDRDREKAVDKQLNFGQKSQNLSQEPHCWQNEMSTCPLNFLQYWTKATLVIWLQETLASETDFELNKQVRILSIFSRQENHFWFYQLIQTSAFCWIKFGIMPYCQAQHKSKFSFVELAILTYTTTQPPGKYKTSRIPAIGTF